MDIQENTARLLSTVHTPVRRGDAPTPTTASTQVMADAESSSGSNLLTSGSESLATSLNQKPCTRYTGLTTTVIMRWETWSGLRRNSNLKKRESVSVFQPEASWADS